MTKIEKLFAELNEWHSVPALLETTGWKPHTLRAALATHAKKSGVELERRREDGLTSYRIKPDDFKPRDDFAKSIEAAYGAIKERVANGGPGWDPKAT